LQLRWRAVFPTISSSLRFLTEEEGKLKTTALRFGGIDRLGEEEDPNDGALPAEVFIDTAAHADGRPVFESRSVSREGGIRLALRPEAESVRVGEEIVVALEMLNGESQFLDTVRVRLWFDPDALEVLDWDRGSWVHRGVNVQDGFARETFPFSFHTVNNADNDVGEIEYQMGMANRFIPPEKADVFKIKFRALRPAAENLLCFDVLPTGDGPATALFYEGANVTDYARMIDDGALFLSLPVLPERQASRRRRAP